MKTWKRFLLGAAAIAVLPGAISAQRWDADHWDDDRWGGDRWEAFGERLAEAMERAAWRLELAFDEDSDFTLAMEEMGHRFDRLGERWDRRWAADLAEAFEEMGEELEYEFGHNFEDLGDDIERHWESIDWSGMRSWGNRADRWEDSGARWDRDRDSWENDSGPRVDADDFEWSGTIGAGETLEIKGVSGGIRAVPSDGNRIEVVARRTARRSDPDDVTIEVIEHRGGVTLCALYPTPDNARRDNECGVGSDGSMSVNRNDTRVEWEVRVPANVLFHARTVNGDIEIEDVAADVVANTVNGDIELETSGAATAETVNGDVRATFNVMREDVEFETVNGSVILDVADDLDADLDASWVNGDLESDLPLRLNGRIGRRSARGMLGEGGPELRVRTVNGSIRIR